MQLLSKKDLVKYFAEMVVVVLGILIAFQVEEWRQNVREQREIGSALVRLKDETKVNLRFCEAAVPASVRQVRMTQVVMDSLQAGHLLESDRSQFEAGLVKLGWLAYPPYQSTVAEEMISTGLLKELDQAELRSNIARIPGSVAASERQFFTQRALVVEPRAALMKLTEFHFDGSIDDSMAAKIERADSTMFEDAIGVSYDFNDLASSSYVKNLAIKAAGNQVHNFGTNQRLCQFFEEINAQLTDQGYL